MLVIRLMALTFLHYFILKILLLGIGDVKLAIKSD
jgi:hypothetical protein